MSLDWGNTFRGGAQGALAGSSFGPFGSLIGGGLGLLGGIFGGDNDEEEETNGILNQIPDQLKQYLTPYINAGQNSIQNLGNLSGEYEKLFKDPNDIISRIGSGYKSSPGYQWKLNQGENAINNAAAAGGMAGTAQHQQQAGELAGNLANQDYYDYLNPALSLFGQGLQGSTGIHQGIFGTGATAAGDLGTSLANNSFARGGLNFQRGLNRNQQNSDLWSNIFSYLGKNK